MKPPTLSELQAELAAIPAQINTAADAGDVKRINVLSERRNRLPQEIQGATILQLKSEAEALAALATT